MMFRSNQTGITWGGDWVGSIDRPHFEVKSNWVIPKGYKLEGQVIVPTSSAVKVQLILEDTKPKPNEKDDDKMKFTNETTKAAVRAVAALTATSIFPTFAFAEEQENDYHVIQESSALTIEELLTNYQILDASFVESVYTVTYERNGELHTVIYDGNSGNVTIDGLIQSGLTYEYNSELAVPTQNDSTKNSITINYSNDAGGGSSAVKPGTNM
ncbi:hypothetical protein [Lysinibacillus xylanilyticus]|uniref:hypothetical protein n=1 Tax=Lysinibacillus xylanilyticus TaxID=582475 RepID=UPI003D992955